jgi:sortase A
MRSILINTITWILISCGAFLLVRGGLDYWESKSGQAQIASEWNADQPEIVHSAPNVAPSARPSSRHSNEQASAAAPSAVAPAPAAGAAIARLSIPRLGAVLYVVEGDNNGDLKRGPGHLIGTAMPGERGNCIIAGHRDTHFRVLKDIRKGDVIDLQRGGETFHYIVDEMSIVSPNNTAPLRSTRNAELNLITCYPFYYVGSAPKRFIVHARLEDQPLRASAG